MKNKPREKLLEELMPLMFGMRRLMKAKLMPHVHANPHAWLRLEVLRYIEKAGEPTMREVALHFQIAAPSATTLIEKLVEEGMATRKRGTKDRRIVCIVISAKGRAALEKQRTHADDVVRELMSVLPEPDLERFIEILRKLHSANDLPKCS